MTTNPYDAIVIGAGHNGLVTAAYLAKAGKKVLVLERRPVVGGIAVTEDIHPGFKVSPCAYACGPLPPRIAADLKLRKHGLEMLPFDPLLFSPLPDGNHLLIRRSEEKIIEEIARFSRADARNYPRFAAMVAKLTGFLNRLSLMTPPSKESTGAADLLELLHLGWNFRRLGAKNMYELLRVLPMNIADLLDDWFENAALKAALAGSAILGSAYGPRAQGTAYLFLHHRLGQSGGGFRSWGFVLGGMGNLPAAIARAAESYGTEIRTGAEVARIVVTDETVSTVVLKNGDEIAANAVVSATDVKNTFLKLVDPVDLDPHFLHKVKNVKFRGALAKVNLALGELPRFNAAPPGGDGSHARGLIHIGPTLDYLERAADDAKYGDYSRRPFVEIAVPSLTDPTLAPAGKHVMSIAVQYAPYHLKVASWNDKREALGDLVVDLVNEYAPNFKSSILHRQVLTPLDLEDSYGLTEGNIYHGEMSLDQLFVMRPVPGWARYRTPIKNLYLCGATTHPGGGITGLPGHNAAREILKDWQRKK